MVQFYAIFQSWVLACVFLLKRVFQTYVWVSPSLELQISGGKNEINGLIDNNHCALPSELILLILQYIPNAYSYIAPYRILPPCGT
ncbi:hypothetical protein B0H10DRAFT_2140822 [Mycena sp. CBHHK59/15]|nr:hypothetical protein B0H10DRAFT_2140822 [Mycena sp. CBHHK59/15]